MNFLVLAIVLLAGPHFVPRPAPFRPMPRPAPYRPAPYRPAPSRPYHPIVPLVPHGPRHVPNASPSPEPSPSIGQRREQEGVGIGWYVAGAVACVLAILGGVYVATKESE